MISFFSFFRFFRFAVYSKRSIYFTYLMSNYNYGYNYNNYANNIVSPSPFLSLFFILLHLLDLPHGIRVCVSVCLFVFFFPFFFFCFLQPHVQFVFIGFVHFSESAYWPNANSTFVHLPVNFRTVPIYCCCRLHGFP